MPAKEMMIMGRSIAIDGPAGAGKSTIAKSVAQSLGYIYVDTGAMYRAIALYFLEENVDIDSESEVKEACDAIDINIGYEGGIQQVYLNDENVTERIRTPEVSKRASITSANPKVREKLLSLQQNLAKANDVIMDGRDIGTTVLPNADLKIFLTASVKTRAKRRYDELVKKGEKVDLESIEEDIKKRDKQDMTRDISPLAQAEDAVLVDTSELDPTEVRDKILALYNKKS